MNSVLTSVRTLLGGRAPGAVILTYHRVATLDHDTQHLAVTPDRFAQHLDVIVKRGRPMPLAEMLSRATSGTLPQGAVAVTFDDGYADNLIEAAPLLQRANVPATIFVSTGPILDEREFWWDELEHAMLKGALARSEYDELCLAFRTLAPDAREDRLSTLARRANVSRLPRESHRPLRPAEVSALAALPGITVGSHTRNHVSLAALDAAAQRAEIGAARDTLVSLTGAPVDLFAYPFGGPQDVSAVTIEAARTLGISAACTTMSGPIDATTDLWSVPRATVRDWPRQEFERRFLAWTGVRAA
jgi:peptidoglycan/xylan/chitin deacetylase (PgdA/CDA1 family)